MKKKNLKSFQKNRVRDKVEEKYRSGLGYTVVFKII